MVLKMEVRVVWHGYIGAWICVVKSVLVVLLFHMILKKIGQLKI